MSAIFTYLQAASGNPTYNAYSTHGGPAYTGSVPPNQPQTQTQESSSTEAYYTSDPTFTSHGTPNYERPEANTASTQNENDQGTDFTSDQDEDAQQQSASTTTAAPVTDSPVSDDASEDGENSQRKNDDAAEETSDYFDVCPQNQINILSIANIANDDVELEKHDIYNFFTIIILLLVLHLMRRIQRQTAIVCDERKLSASDYAVRVSNLPKDFEPNVDIDEAIKDHFVRYGIPGVRLNVQAVSVCYDCKERKMIEDKLAKTVEARAKLKARKNAKTELISDDEISRLKVEIQQYRDQLTVIEKKFQEGVGVSKQFKGEAFVIFETQQGFQYKYLLVLRGLEQKQVARHWDFGIFGRIKHIFTNNSIYKFRGKVLRVEEAPEPSDVYWENVGYSKAAKRIFELITNLTTVFVLLVGFTVAFYIQRHKVIPLLLN